MINSQQPTFLCDSPGTLLHRQGRDEGCVRRWRWNNSRYINYMTAYLPTWTRERERERKRKEKRDNGILTLTFTSGLDLAPCSNYIHIVLCTPQVGALPCAMLCYAIWPIGSREFPITTVSGIAKRQHALEQAF